MIALIKLYLQAAFAMVILYLITYVVMGLL